jgi:hypothetical protein
VRIWNDHERAPTAFPKRWKELLAIDVDDERDQEDRVIALAVLILRT